MKMRLIKLYIIIILLPLSIIIAQFGQNKVQYKDYEWFYIQTEHFDIYFTEEGSVNTEFCALTAEDAIDDIQKKLDYQINNRISIIIYNSHNDFQETNTTDSYLGQGTGGFTEPFKNRVVFPFEGSYKKFRHVIHHELVHAVMRDMLYGGTVQNIVSKGISLQLPHWFHEGMAEYLSSDWETNSDMFIRNAIINDFLPNINELTGYFGYRGGQSVMKFIADKYGKEKIGELLHRINDLNNFEAGLRATIGLNVEELNEQWKKEIKVQYWPEIASRDEPEDFSKRLTETKNGFGFYNTSPAISPVGDKMAFISDRDIYLDVYVRDIRDEEKIQKVISSGTTFDFEELNILFPALTWSPDNKHIALSLKHGGDDVISIINIETEEFYNLPIQMNGIESVSWSPDGKKIAFSGHDAKQSDIFIYDFDNKSLSRITDDIFTDVGPVWGPKNDMIYFSSDRGAILDSSMIDENFNIYDHNFKQLDLYQKNIETNNLTRLTDWELSDELSPVISPEGDQILFTSDKNGITNIYKKQIVFTRGSSGSSISDLEAAPVTNSLNEVQQLSLSQDGMKLIYTTLYKKGYNIFLIDNPFDLKIEQDSLTPTPFMAHLEAKNKGIISDLSFFSDSPLKNNDSTATGLSSADVDNIKKDKNRRSFIFTGDLVVDEETDSLKEDYTNYIFGTKEVDTTDENFEEALFTQKLDKEGNYLVNKYKINFTPDLIYANAGWSTFYGLMGTTVLSFSDILGNHRLVGITGFQIDLKNSDYGLSYYYLPKKINYGIDGFHTARFVYLYRNGYPNLFRFRNYGGVLSASIPLNRFYRFETSVSGLNITSENLDNMYEPMEKVFYMIPSVSFVHDNTMWGYYSPIQGNRYSFTVFGNLGFGDARKSFYSVTWDIRKYMRFLFDNSFVFRFSGGYSGGNNPQRFMLGGTSNWINRSFATGTIPIENASDFAFMSPAMPLRGYRYGEQLGTKYMLFNFELRMPIIRYLLAGPIIPLFFQNIIGAAFVDVGTAWTNNEEMSISFKRPREDYSRGMLFGTGIGARTFLLFFLVRFDVAWAYDNNGFSTPKYYFSLGVDF